MWECSCGKALAAAEIVISTPAPSAWLILSEGWWKDKMTFKSVFQLHFIWFLLSAEKVTKLILNSLVGVLRPGHYLFLQTVVWWERQFRGVVHPEIVQKKIPETPQGLPFKGVTDANKQAWRAGHSADLKNKAPCWTSCPKQHPKPSFQCWPALRYPLMHQQTESDKHPSTWEQPGVAEFLYGTQ